MISRPVVLSRGLRAAAAVLAVALIATGCGGGEDDLLEGAGTSAPSGETLEYAIDGRLTRIDPLLVEGRGAELLARQIHEPLVDTLIGPFGEIPELPGLAESVEPSENFTVWTVNIRSGVEFQDGGPLNADAVLANVYERWLKVPEASEVAAGLVAADSPRPAEIRFILDSPDEQFDERLASPALGLVSPVAISPKSGTIRRGARGTGTGPFELRERSPNSEALLASNVDWWGAASELLLGPGIDQIHLLIVASASERLQLLREGTVQVADGLSESEVASVEDDPLLGADRTGSGPYLAFERSVRGLPAAGEIDSLAGVWLTSLGQG